MSVNMNTNIEVGGLISQEGLNGKNKLKPGTKLSAMKNAVYFQKKSGDGETKQASLLRMTEEERKVHRENIKGLEADQRNMSDATAETASIRTNASVFRRNVYTETINNTNFVVDNTVAFTGDEMSKTTKVVNEALSSLKIPGSSLDYIDYAQMGIVENTIRSFAKENLNEEQTELVLKTVSDHMGNMISKELEESFVIDDRYYGKRDNGDVVQRMQQYIKDMVAKSDLPEQTKRNFAAKRVGSPVMIMSASNMELTDSIRTMFADMDWEDDNVRRSAFEKYSNQILPAYLEVHGGEESAAQRHIQKDIAFFEKYYGELKKTVQAACVAHVDLQI